MQKKFLSQKAVLNNFVSELERAQRYKASSWAKANEDRVGFSQASRAHFETSAALIKAATQQMLLYEFTFKGN